MHLGLGSVTRWTFSPWPILEDIGVTPYAGAAGMLKTRAIITTAARILAAEAADSGSVHTQVTRLKIPSLAVDGADLIPPPSGKTTQYLSINSSNGLAATRTAEQVLYLAFGMTANAKQEASSRLVSMARSQ